MPQTQRRPGGESGAGAVQAGEGSTSLLVPTDYIEWLWDEAYTAGQLAERHRIAAAQAELEVAWRPIGRRTYAEQVTRRIAELPGSATPRPLRFDDPDWPAVALPGAPGVRLGLASMGVAA